MNIKAVLSSAMIGLAATAIGAQTQSAPLEPGAVFVMTNAALNNEVIGYQRYTDGSLVEVGTFMTGGNGSGGTIDPLKSQGSLVLTADHHWLFAVNAGSGTVSTFRVQGANLTLVDDSPSGGSMPTAVAHHGDLLYVLNAGGNGNVAGFRVGWDGHLNKIPNSARWLSSSAASPTSVTFSKDGRFLVVTEVATGNIDVFRVREDGSISEAVVNPSLDQKPFSAAFTDRGELIVDAASNFVSSYAIKDSGELRTITASLPTDGMATCWNVITPDNRFTYTSNAASGTISGFSVARDGALSALPGTTVATNPTGSANLDAALSKGGLYLYTLDAGTGAISQFSVERDGALTGPQLYDGLPAGAGLQGIAAY